MDEDTDSRTAAFERKRPQGESENDTHRVATSGQSTPRKRVKRQDMSRGQAPGDSGPVGRDFSRSRIPMDDRGDSRSDVSSDSDANKVGAVSPSLADQKLGGAAPSINWNVGSRARIRTTLGGSRTVNQTSPQASMSLSAATTQVQAKDSPIQESTECTPRLIGSLPVQEDGPPTVALNPSVPEIPGTKSGVLSPNVEFSNPPPGTVHTSLLDNANGVALERAIKEGEVSGNDDAVPLNLQSEQESGKITEADLELRKDEGNKTQVEIGRMEFEEPVTVREQKQLGSPEESNPSKNNVIVKNLPYDLSETEVCQLR